MQIKQKVMLRFLKKALLFSLLFVIFQCSQTQEAIRGKTAQVVTESGLIYEIIKAGSGDMAKEGDEVMIHETTSYMCGKLLFSSRRDMWQPLKFKVGGKMVIEGVDEGVRGMRIGEIRKMIIPPALSKRSVYPDFLSPDSTLLYVVELIDMPK
jgi:FKBP-type peptidyl-prolyl cis-trans isomerase